jgi:hypothetical protein
MVLNLAEGFLFCTGVPLLHPLSAAISPLPTDRRYAYLSEPVWRFFANFRYPAKKEKSVSQ